MRAVHSSTAVPLDVWDPQVQSEENFRNWTAVPVARSPSTAVTENGPVLVDLFCGAGGFSTGLEAAGFESAIGLDIHTPSCETYALNHPMAWTLLGDIRRVPPPMIQMALGGRTVDLVTAGVPCQGFSICNRKRHDGDRRNWLFREFIRFVRLLEPRAVVLENVSTLRSAAAGTFAQRIEKAIARSGYHVESRVLNAADFGVPQVRRRLFFIGLRRGRSIHWPQPTHGNGRRPHVTVWEAIGDLPPLAGGERADHHTAPPQNPYQELMRQGTDVLHNHVAPRHPRSTVEKIANTRPGEPMYPRFTQRIRLHPRRPSPTQVSGGIRPQFSLGHPTQPRGLTVRERCRLQSIPDHQVITGGIVQGRVQTGNAVPPRLAEAIGQVLITQL